MNLFSVCLIIGLIMFLLYFLSGVFYLIKKPKVIINRKLYRIEKLYTITSVNDYLNNLGKRNLYSSILFLVGLIIVIYRDINKYPHSNVVTIVYLILNCILNSIFKSRINKYLDKKNTYSR